MDPSQLPKFNVDITRALKSGHTEQRIARDLSDLANTKLREQGLSFNYQQARDGGMTDAEIIRQFGSNVVPADKKFDESVGIGTRVLGEIPLVNKFTSNEGLTDYEQRRFFEGFAESGGALGGAYRGGQLGLLATAAIPIPGARVVGGLVGGIGGMLLGHFLGGKAADIEYAEDAVDVLAGDYKRPQQVPSERPAGETAYTLGASVPFLAVPWMLPKQGVNFGSAKYLDNVTKAQKAITGSKYLSSNAKIGGATGDVVRGAGRLATNVAASGVKAPGYLGKGVEYLGTAAQKSSQFPKRTLAIETGGIAGAAGMAYGAQEYFPENPIARAIGEVTGGFLGTLPSIRMLVGFGQRGGDVAGEGLLSRIVGDEEAQKTGVAQRFYQIIEEAASENPRAYGMDEYEEGKAVDFIVQKLLQDDELGGVTRTSAQKAGVPILNDIEINLLRQNLGSNLSATAQQRAENTLSALRSVLKDLGDSDNPRALQDYAKLRDQYFNDLLGARLTQESLAAYDASLGKVVKPLAEAAEGAKTAKEAQKRLQEGDALDPEVLGVNMRDALYKVLGEARNQERLLWNAVDRTPELEAGPLIDAYNKLTSRISEGKEIPGEMRKLFENLEQEAAAAGTKAGDDAIAGINPTLRESAEEIATNAGGYDEAIAFLKTRIENPAYSPEEVKRFQSLSEAMQTLKNAKEGAVSTGGQTVDLDRLLNFRSDMLQMAKEKRAGNNPDVKMAGIAGNLAEEVNKLIDNSSGLVGKSYDDARAFSRALNDVFRRSFVGTGVTAKKPSGDFVHPPETLIDAVAQGNGRKVNLRMVQMEDAVRFMANKGESEKARAIANESFSTLREAEDGMLRLAAAEAVFKNGELNVPALRNFLNKYRKPMQDLGFDNLLNDLQDVNKAKLLFEFAEQQRAQADSAINLAVTFRNFVGEEDAGRVIGNAIGEPGNRPVTRMADGKPVSTPAKNFKALLRMVNRKDAPENLKSAFYEAIMDKAYLYAGGEGENFSFTKMKNFLFEPLSKGEGSPMTLMRDAGVIDNSRMENLRALFQISGVGAGRAGREGEDIKDLVFLNKDDAAEDALARMVGAGLGVKVMRFLSNLPVVGSFIENSTGGSLVAANIGSEQLRGYLEQMPRALKSKLWDEIAKSPEFAAEMLIKGREKGLPKGMKPGTLSQRVKESAKEVRPIDATGRTAPLQGAAGFIPRAAPDVYDYLMREEEKPVQPPMKPQAPVQPPMAPAPAPTAQGPTQPTARAQMSQLFPNDPILGSRSGIGSLMT